MCLLSDIQPVDLPQLLENFRSRAASMSSPLTAARYSSAIASLAAYLSTATLSQILQAPLVDTAATAADTEPAAPIQQAPLANWIAMQSITQTPFSTAQQYLDIISSLYGNCAKEGLVPPTKVFSETKAALKALGEDLWTAGINEEIFARALRLTKNAANCVSDDAIAVDIVLWSLTHGCMPLSDVALLKKQDVEKELQDDNLSFIINNLSLNNSRRKYVFPLHQPDLTPRQLSLRVNEIVTALFRRARLPLSNHIFGTVQSLWAYAALSCGVSGSKIVGILGHAPVGIPVLRLCPKEEVDPVERAAIIQKVATIFLSNPIRWYAMNLRPGVRFTQLSRRLELLGDRLPSLRLFYPCEEIARTIGKKVVMRQRPFITQVVFFSARLTDIVHIFAKIGDLAWCYTRTGKPGSPYADISQRQFDIFQQTIARFTPDFEVAEAGELKLRPNDRVKVVGGLFTGLEAAFQGISPSSKHTAGSARRYCGKAADTAQSADTSDLPADPSIVYRLKLIGDNGIDWRINLDPRLISAQ